MRTERVDDLITKVLDAYWSSENVHLTMASRLRMKPVLRAIAEEIRTWAPDEGQARICYLAINEVADRLVRIAEQDS